MAERTDPAKIAIIAHVALFEHCDRRELGHIARLMDEHEIAQGTVLTKQGDDAGDFFVIIEGEATVTRDGDAIAVLGEGDFFGELSLLDGGPRTATVTATSPMFVLGLPPGRLEELVTQHPSVALTMLRTLAARLRGVEESHQH
jgi:CRP/FNR family transcriptional regulator, cyclic AMP receptor protein